MPGIRIGAIAVAVAATVVGAVLVVGAFGGPDPGPPAEPAPILAAGDQPFADPAPRAERVTIPKGFLMVEPTAAKPLHQEGVRWVRSDDPDLPALVSPCGGGLRSDTARVAGRQIALIGPKLWKVERLVVYRDVAAARRAMTERRVALRECRRHRNPGGAVTHWTSRALRIGDEALFVTSRRSLGGEAVAGSHRGVLMRKGRVVEMLVDFGPRTRPSPLAEVASYQRQARSMARKLASAPLG